MLSFNRTLIFLGGDPSPATWTKSIYRKGDFIISADRGYIMCCEADLNADILLGDMDSLPENYVKLTSPQHILRYPTDKDYSDGELALLQASKISNKEVLILGALGGRLDHCLFNVISLLEKADELSLKATIMSPEIRAFQLGSTQKRTLSGVKGWHCSLISLDKEATVSAHGFRYNLDNEVITRNSTRGLSNIVLDAEKSILEVQKGRMLVILTHPTIK